MREYKAAFTIVELIIVILVIAILSAIIIVSYGGVVRQVNINALKQNTANAATTLNDYANWKGSYPDNAATANVTMSSSDMSYVYNVAATHDAYCLAVMGYGKTFVVTQTNKSPQEGICNGTLAVYTDSSPANWNDANLNLTANGFYEVDAAWNTYAGATSYIIQWSTSSDFSWSTSAVPSTNSYNITGLSMGTTYYARVLAVTPTGQTAWSPVQNATTGSYDANGFALTTPDYHAIGASWNTYPGASSYVVQYSTDSAFGGTPGSTSPAGTSTTITGLTSSTTYYVRFAAVVSGSQTAWLSTKNITTKAAPPITTGFPYYLWNDGQATVSNSNGHFVMHATIWVSTQSQTSNTSTVCLTGYVRTDNGTLTYNNSNISGNGATGVDYNIYAVGTSGASGTVQMTGRTPLYNFNTGSGDKYFANNNCNTIYMSASGTGSVSIFSQVSCTVKCGNSYPYGTATLGASTVGLPSIPQ